MIFDQLFTSLEKLVTEHGSAAVLREHLGLLKAKLAEYEAQNAHLKAQAEESEARALHAERRAREAEEQLQTLTAGQNLGPACEACGSAKLVRSGTRPVAGAFARLGLKEALFTCSECGHVSARAVPS